MRTSPLTRAVAFLALFVLHLPLIALVVGSVHYREQGSGDQWAWGLKWYLNLVDHPRLWEGLWISLEVALASTVVSTVMGTAAAFALERKRVRGQAWVERLILLPILMPEIIMGLSLLVWFVFLRITLGEFSIILAHITFCVSYVTLIVRSRLHDSDLSLEEAARDLGASPSQAFWRVTFPLALPGIAAGAVMGFTLSFDDFFVTFFTTGVNSDTLPLRIYSMIRFGLDPSVNALSTLLLIATAVPVYWLFRPTRAGNQLDHPSSKFNL